MKYFLQFEQMTSYLRKKKLLFFFLYVLTTDILHIHVHVYFTDSLQQDNGAIRFVCI